MFIMVDGIDGCGKSTVVEAWSEALVGQGKRIFSVKEFCLTNGRLPTPEDAAGADVIFSVEPTYAWIGAAIRNEMIVNGTMYSARAVATVFSQDRLVLYNRFLLPMRKQGKIIIQDRGISSSIAYQPIQSPNIDLDFVLTLEGNAFALEHAPDVLVICTVAANRALKRLATRADKKDNHIFERRDFLHQLEERFASGWFRKLFEGHGTKVVYFDASTDIQSMQDEAKKILPNLTLVRALASSPEL